MGPLFDQHTTLANKKFFREVVDICANHHRGNAESNSAFQSIKNRLTEREEHVLDVIRAHDGVTAEQIADQMGVSVNQISGRCSALKFKGKVKMIGTRLTRSGCKAAVLKAV